VRLVGQRQLLSRILRRAGVPSRRSRPVALPGAATFHELRWALRTRRAPTITPEEYGKTAEVGEIEEIIGCSLCGERRFKPLLHPNDRKRGRWSYHVVRCPSCGFLYRNPGIRPERLGDLYEGSYGSFLTGSYAHKRQRRYRLVMDAFSPVLDEGDGRRLFDFGCGAGLFLDVALERGFDPYGVDLSQDSVDKAREKPSGRNAYFGAPDEVPEIAAGGFDVVTMWSVLAHLATPVEDLTMLRGLLGPDGVLLILTVNANSLRLKALGDEWNGFTPNHLKFYSPKTLPILLMRAGFQAVAMPPMYGDPIEAGTSKMSPKRQERVRRVVTRGNRGNMLRALAFADPDGPRRWGIDEHVTYLSSGAGAAAPAMAASKNS
jgi:SAM-dependent methyltransferase